MTSTPRGLLRGVLPLAATLLLAAVGVGLGWHRLRLRDLAPVHVDAAWIAAAVAANLASILAKALLWHVTVRAAAPSRRSPVAAVVPALFIGFFANTVLFGRAGEVVRIGVLQRSLRRRGYDVTYLTLAGTVASETVALGVALVLVVAAIALVVPSRSFVVPSLAGLTFVLAFAALAAAVPRRLQRRGTAGGRWQRTVARLETVASSARQPFRRGRVAAAAIAVGVGAWIAQLASIGCALRAFGVDASVGAASLVFLATTVVGVVPLLPANVGVFQGVVTAVLVGTYGVDPTRALAFSVGLHAVELLFGVAVGAVFVVATGVSIGDLRGLARGRSTTGGVG